MAKRNIKEDFPDNIYNENLGPDPDNVLLEGGVAGLSELGIGGGIGLSEIAMAEERAMDDIERRELLVNPSDLQDIGDPESGDVGVPGGMAAGGEMGEGGFGHVSDDPWGSELIEEAPVEALGWGGVGSIESEIGELEDEKLKFEEEKM